MTTANRPDPILYLSDARRGATRGAHPSGDQMTVPEAIRDVRRALVGSDDLRRAPWKGSRDPIAGHCYVASECLALMLGPDWRPRVMRHEGATHWYLQHTDGRVADATATQFRRPPSYHKGRGCGFLTREPSKRARILAARIIRMRGLFSQWSLN